MASIRLRADQIDRLRECDNASAVIRYAVHRWRRGDFVIGAKPRRKKGGEILRVFPIWKKADGIADWQYREILDRHWAVRDEEFEKKLDREIAALDREIAGMFQLLPPFVIEGNAEL